MRWAYAAAGPAGLLLCGTASGQATAPAQQSFQVSADVVQGCVVATAGPSLWGTIDLGNVSGVASGTATAALVTPEGAGIQINCTPGTAASVAADLGRFASGGTRRLSLAGDPTHTIPYRLYVNGGATEWTTQSISLTFGANLSRLTLPVIGTATLSGSQKAGVYADTVHVTVSW